MKSESNRMLARGEGSQVEITEERRILVSTSGVSISLDPEEFLDLCGTLFYGLQNYRNNSK